MINSFLHDIIVVISFIFLNLFSFMTLTSKILYMRKEELRGGDFAISDQSDRT